MPKVLIISYSDIDRDPRVLRQIDFFNRQGYQILLSALDYQGSLSFYPLIKSKKTLARALKLAVMIGRLNRLRVWDFMRHSSAVDILKDHPELDLIIANDAETWPIGSFLKRNNKETKLILDAHEFYPTQFTDNLKWTWFHSRFATFICKNYISHADLLITVCDGLAEAYGPYTTKEVQVVMNAPKYESKITPVPTGETIRIVHHGIANRSRKIEKMIELLDTLDTRFELNFILMPTDEIYLQELKKLAQGKSIKFFDPVATESISNFINQFDIGLFYLEPVNFNYTFALPNKFFEFIQARLAIAIGPSIEMKKIVKREMLGIISDEFDVKELATSLNSLTSKDIDHFKSNANRVAKKYSADQHDKFYLNLIKEWDLLGKVNKV
jgi:hypothetical protein